MRETVRLMILAVAVLLITACSAQVDLTGEAAAEVTRARTCPEAGTDTRLLVHPQHGYCLLYPIAYKVEKPSSGQTDLVIGSLLNVTDPRVGIAVEAANGRTAAELADQVALDPNFEAERAVVSIGGVNAILLDKLPGQVINRQLFFDHQGLVYRLTFLPVDENVPAYAAMEQLYDMILATFTFIPVAQDLAAGYDCLQPKAGEVTLTNSDLGFCLLHPEGFTAENTGENQAVLYVDSAQCEPSQVVR